ncbi:hypothetical protein ALSL_0055 [Aerosticca soli]|uniref:Uncharacterized protein n=1 Tax=Aerosticca soli TaxID=2010829 RepID=A0A2Z6E1W0_9GAMM|nr:hypothetical protein ALSL_0055 [Aerosticca soli]
MVRLRAGAAPVHAGGDDGIGAADLFAGQCAAVEQRDQE